MPCECLIAIPFERLIRLSSATIFFYFMIVCLMSTDKRESSHCDFISLMSQSHAELSIVLISFSLNGKWPRERAKEDIRLHFPLAIFSMIQRKLFSTLHKATADEGQISSLFSEFSRNVDVIVSSVMRSDMCDTN